MKSAKPIIAQRAAWQTKLFINELGKHSKIKMKFFPVTSRERPFRQKLTAILVEALPQDRAIGGYIFEFSVGIVQNKSHKTK